MEIDMHSPSFRRMRSVSTKRTRSPDSPAPADRPSKRPSLAIHNGLPSPVMPQAFSPSEMNSGSGNRSQFSSEDWVQQTDGLTIETRLLGPSLLLPEIREGGGPDQMDAQMTMDSGETTNPLRPQLPLPRHMHNSRLISRTTEDSTATPSPQHVSYETRNQQEHQNQQSPFISAPTNLPYPAQPYSALQLQMPHVHIQPATPSDDSPDQQNHDNPFHDSSLPPTRPPSTAPASPMCISPKMSWSASPTPTPSTSRRKQRFTMGPRIDCEMCRLGVKGHWMHFD